MFKLVVLCVFAVAVAEPDPALLYSAGLSYSAWPGVLPATIAKTSHLIAQPSPFVYSGALGYSHFIKKRSAEAEPEPEAKPEPEPTPEAKADPQFPLFYSSSLVYPKTLTSPVITNPFIPYSYPYEAALPWATHLIKKRSAQFLAPTTYVPSTYALPSYNPYLSTYLGNNIYPSALDSVVLNQHLIKKRSADVLSYSPYATPYAVPSYYNNIYPAVPTTYIGSNVYPNALNTVVGLHAIKKRSAALLTAPTLIAPTTYGAASPYFTSTYAASSPLISTYPYVSSPYAYSTYIKK